MNSEVSALVVESVSHRYDQTQALSEVSFEIARGTFFGLLGPNGSGKTTLFRLLATLLPLQSGTIRVFDTDLKTSPAKVRRQLGITFQSPALDPRLTVRENLNCHGRIYGLSGKSLKDRIDRGLRDFQLADRATERVENLSGGLKRRVELAKGLLHDPKILMLDEPSTGLDPAARRQFWDLVRQQQREYGTTMIVSTHLMEEAAGCDQLLLLDQGQVLREGSPQELQATLHGQRLSVRTIDNKRLQPELEQLLQASASVAGDELCFRTEDAAGKLQYVMQQFQKDVLSAQVSQPTLEDVFLETTGRRLTADEGNDHGS
jgi:ABC-2 type transport system ATP-binding protein